MNNKDDAKRNIDNALSQEPTFSILIKVYIMQTGDGSVGIACATHFSPMIQHETMSEIGVGISNVIAKAFSSDDADIKPDIIITDNPHQSQN